MTPRPLAPDPARRTARTASSTTTAPTVLAEAIDALAALRTPYWLGDSGVHLHALASLLAHAQQLLPEAVAQARDQELTWNEIGQLLGLAASTAARRYPTPPPPARRPDPCLRRPDRSPRRSRRPQHTPHRSRCQG